MPTPWVRFKTAKPVAFECIPTVRGLIVTGGPDVRYASCRFTIATSQIELLDPATDRKKIIPAAGIVLPEWKGTRVPTVELHPFALLHLLVSEPLLRTELLGLVTATTRRGGGVTGMSLPTSTRCNLLRQMKVPRATIAFATHYDVHVAE